MHTTPSSQKKILSPRALLRAGETCWRLEKAQRIAIAIDTDAYFRALSEGCEQAENTIFILGWDFDRRERLGRHRGAPRLGDFLCQLLRENPRLHIYLLLWDFHIVYAAERELFQSWKLRLQGHTRLHVQLDGRHPSGGSQHQKLVDPDEPISPDYFVNRFVPRSHRSTGRCRAILFLALIVVLLGAAVAWRWTPLADWLDANRIADALRVFENPVLRAATVLCTVIFASLLMLPLTVLVVAAALMLGAWEGFGMALVGALISAMLAFALGHFLSRDVLTQLTGSRLARLSKRLSERGVPAVIVLRLVPVAPFTVINLVSGASHLKTGQFLVGSALGLAPGILALTLFSDSLYKAVTNPGIASLGVLAAVVALLIGGTLGLRRMLRSSR